MSDVTPDRALSPYTLAAYNYAAASENRIHSDEVAGKLGYQGALVPGVSMYAYMTVPVVQELGRAWLAHGSMNAKFVHAVYDEETVRVTGRVTSAEPFQAALSLVNPDDRLCAVGTAYLPERQPSFDISQYSFEPPREEKLAPDIALFTEGLRLASLPIDVAGRRGEYEDLLEEMRDPLPIYRGPKAPPHPALWVIMANQLLMESVALGPWIHTASDVQHHELPEPGEELFMHGRVAHSYTKRDHDIVVLDIAVLGDRERPIAHLTHTAIIQLAQLKT